MRKILLSFLFGCMVFFPGHASTSIILDGGGSANPPVPPTVSTILLGEIGEDNEDRPLYVSVPRDLVPSYLMYDPSSSTLYINEYRPDIDFFVLQNITTGEFYYYPYDGLEAPAIPFSGGEGIWRLTEGVRRITRRFVLYEYYFTIINGMVIGL